jgi:trans-aconitate 2-methyltransferase
MTWNPQQYLQFEDERVRPALDLLARVRAVAPRVVVDLGCGAGNVTRLLGARWPEARIIGVDNSATMLAKARAAVAGDARYTFVEADLQAWRPDAPADVVYSNAALQWLGDHAGLFPRVAQMAAAGGTLAIQMPDNVQAPSHTTSIALAQSERWRGKLAHLVRTIPVARPAEYFNWLTPVTRTLDIWTTEYLQVMPARPDGEHPVAAWTRGTWLVPYMQALDEAEAREFLTAYERALAAAYPPLPDGRTLFPFKRLFIIANR